MCNPDDQASKRVSLAWSEIERRKDDCGKQCTQRTEGSRK